MKDFVSKIWKFKGGVFFLGLYLAATFAYFPNMLMSFNGLISPSFNTFSLFQNVSSFSMRLSVPIAVFSCLFSGLIVAFVSFVFIKFSVALFGLVYARSYGRFATVDELPLDKPSLNKLIAVYAMICDVLLGLFRLVYLFVPMAYLIVEALAKPLIFGAMFFPFFFLIRKYFLEGRVSYNVLLALSVPFIIFLLLFC